jgi:excisionase family DNA binding protein
MTSSKLTLSVFEAARLCGVSRGTVGYWLRSGKLSADRQGRRYVIPASELLFFLKSTGQKIPEELAAAGVAQPSFRMVVDCWEYWKNRSDLGQCGGCLVLENHLKVCFEARGCRGVHCRRVCRDCRYYNEFYLPRIQFIHQIDQAAAVYKDFCFWGVNERFAELCRTSMTDLVGMGIEKVFHPDSLEALIANCKRKDFGDRSGAAMHDVCLKNSRKDKVRVRIGDYRLNEPPGASLMIVAEGPVVD